MRNEALRPAVIACVTAGLLASGCSSSEDRTERDAFFKAASALEAAPAIGYSTQVAGAELDMRVTRDGAATGTFSLAGMRLGLLSVGDKSYVRWQKGAPIGGVSPDEAGLADGKWITGGTSSGVTQTLTPQQIASTVTAQLNDSKTRFPRRSTTVKVSGTTAWKATTPSNDVYVTRSTPHRIVRITPRGAGGKVPSLPPVPSLPSGLPSLPSDLPSLPSGFPSLPDVPAGLTAERAGRSQARAAVAAVAPALPGQMDLKDMDQQQVDALFDDLVKNTRQLKDSFDLSYQFNTRGSAAFTGCGPGACTVTVTLANTFTSKNLKPPPKVDATMTVTMTGDGSPVGGCTTSGPLPVNATGTLSCTNVSPQWNSWYFRAQAQRGTHVYTALARVLGRAITSADIDRLIEELHRRHEEYQRNLNSPTPSPSDCTPQAPTYGPLNDGRGTSGHAVLCEPLQSGSAAGIAPKGYNAATFDRGHLIGDQFGGSGRTVANIVPLYKQMNQVVMRTCENRVADLVKTEQPVDYTVTANYVAGKVIPDSVTMIAMGSKGTIFTKTIPNTPSASHVCKK